MRNRLGLDRRALAFVLGAAALLAVCSGFVLPAFAEAMSYLLPALLLLAALAARRYPGEQALLAVMGRARRRHQRARAAARSPSRPRAMLPRGGALIATSLAVRPPPPAAAARA
jgi:hypothetical protein